MRVINLDSYITKKIDVESSIIDYIKCVTPMELYTIRQSNVCNYITLKSLITEFEAKING